LKAAYHTLVHLLGLGCVAACLAIVGTMGALDIHWAGWIAVGLLGLLAVGIVAGWFPWSGKPLRMLIKGVYVMSAIALIGFGFSIKDPMRPQLWMVLVPLAAAIVLRLLVRGVMRGQGEANKAPRALPKPPELAIMGRGKPPEMTPYSPDADDTFVN
jgi:peptidoglycan/LPS O-acetylase OafA/YrhL